MPTYQYICDKCGHTFDLFQSITAKTLTVCPKEHCAKAKWGRGKIRRAIGAGGGLIFKGSGFYTTDYRSEAYKTAAKQDAPAPAPSSSGSASEGKSPSATPAPKAPKDTTKSGTKTASN